MAEEYGLIQSLKEENAHLRAEIKEIRELVRKVDRCAVVKKCPACGEHTFVLEHICCSDFPNMVEYAIMCSKECGFSYQVYESRVDLMKAFSKEHFIEDGRQTQINNPLTEEMERAMYPNRIGDS